MAGTQKTIHTLTGRIVGDKVDKIVAVLIERRVKHPVYDKYAKRSTKLHAHDESNQYRVDGLVAIRETRPLTKTRAWTLVNIVKRAVEV